MQCKDLGMRLPGTGMEAFAHKLPVTNNNATDAGVGMGGV